MIVGAGSARLVVPPGTPLGGYADRTEPATGVLDELQVRCLTIRSAGATLVLVVVDLVCVNVDLAAAVTGAVVRRLGRDGVEVWTMATHTHSGPDQNCGPGDRSTPPRWLAAVPGAAAEAAAEAERRAAPASLSLRTGLVHDVGAVRAVADAPAEVPVDVLSIDSADGRRHGIFAVFPVHPTVLPATSSLVSADLTGAVRRALTKRLGAADSAPWAILATGCAGDISTRTTRRAQTPAEVDRLGEVAAAELEQILAGPAVRTVAGDPPLRSGRRTLLLPLRADEPRTKETPRGGSEVEQRIAHTVEQGQKVARERRARHPDGHVVLEVCAAAIGDLRLVGLGAEPYLAVRKLVTAPALVLGYVGGYAGYLPDEPGFATATYELLSSPFRPDAALTAVRAAEDLLANTELEKK